MIARLKGRRSIQEDLGTFRDWARDEELFAEIALAYLKGIRGEVAKLFGPTKARKLLDPFTK